MAQMRLDKLLAQAAELPRSKARREILAGRVTVDGVVCRQPDQKVESDAALGLAGRPLCWQQQIYLMVDKPAGLLSASRDASCRTVVDLVRDQYPRRALFPAGRLDKDSTGFVLLTDDGPLAHALLSPKHHVEKVYRVTLDCPATEEMRRGFARGVTLADGQRMLPAGLEIDSEDPAGVTVTLHQGVYHQIKRMFGVYGAGVATLRRVAIGGVALDPTLGPGGSRPLTAAELARLRGVLGELGEPADFARQDG